MTRDGVQRLLLIRLRIAGAQRQRLVESHTIWHISIQGIVRRSLVGKNVWQHPALGQLRNNVGAIPYQTYRNVLFLAHRIL